ncbi:MAG: glycosyltransferase family 4 protein [bacterium]|nr:glycosyltransferase family 4 protein [bacterium]MDZ4299853.1 glycosyltransferase family 4 protein [Candidatus Sungbacteria bacterium]
MNILMLSEDPVLAVPGSEAHERVREYARVCGEMTVVVLTADAAVRGMGAMDSLTWYAAAARSPFLRRWRAFRMVRTLCRRRRFDALTVQAPDEMGLLMYLFARVYGIPLQVQVHADIMSPWYRRASWRERACYYFARFLLPRADGIRVVSERIARSLTGQPMCVPRERISILPVATDISRFISAVPDSELTRRFSNFSFKIIAVGRFVEREKNFFLLIRAMARLVEKNPYALLVLVGAGPDEARYRRAIISRKLERNIIIEPWRTDLPVFLKSFDCLALSSYFEGWGRVVVEAMAAGVPVIMTDVGLAGELVHNGREGLVVAIDDEIGFAGALATMAGDRALRTSMGERAQDAVSGHLDNSREKYLADYRASFLRLVGALRNRALQ